MQISGRIRGLMKSFGNLYHFFGVVWHYRDYDYAYSLGVFSKALELLANGLERRGLHQGYRIDVAEIHNCVASLDRIANDCDCPRDEIVALCDQLYNLERWWD